MDERGWPTEQFEEQRSRLRAVAYRMLGSVTEADDAVQETWLRYDRADTSGVQNLAAWLTTVVTRVCLNMLRTRESHREEPLDEHLSDSVRGDDDPEQAALLADSVGFALLVVLDTLTPAERIAFVLHDMFAVPFDDIAAMIDRSPTAARQLASRARRRVKGVDAVPDADLSRQRRVVDAYLAAARGGDFEALVSVLDPEVVLRADRAVVAGRSPVVIHGVRNVTKGALLAAARSRCTEAALIDGAVGLVMARHGRLAVALRFTIVDDRITEIDVIGEPHRLGRLALAVLDG